MSYIVFARKYRPQSFDDVVGQAAVSKTLLNAIESGRIAHAYIFSGPRGIGKTTTARILAKCLNCEKGPTITPCQKCDSCRTISDGSSMDDVLEIDGASNRGIEQIRELRENAKYTPARSRYRIYIIDEAHQITKDAFGALLKTLEEPPAHVIFMMATTEVHKIPAPILSRCQRFSLRPIAPDLVLNHLKQICQSEKVKVEDEALKYIVRFVEGSLRDALSLLDQAVVFAPKGITTQTLRDLLGLLPTEIITQFAADIEKGDPAELLKRITNLIHEGVDLTQLAKDVQNYYHTLLLIKAGVNDPLLSNDEAVRKQSETLDFPTLERFIRLLAKSLEEMRRSDSPRAVFEIYALKMSQKVLDPRALIQKVDQFLQKEKNNPAPSSPSTGFSKPTPPPAQKKTENSWTAFVEDVISIKQALGAALEESIPTFSDNGLLLTFAKSFNEGMVKKSWGQLSALQVKHFGSSLSLQTDIKAGEKGSGLDIGQINNVRSPDLTPSLQEIPSHDVSHDVQNAMTFFPGVLKREVKIP